MPVRISGDQREVRGWPGFAGVEPEAAAGARGFVGPALRCTGGRVVRCFGFLRLR